MKPSPTELYKPQVKICGLTSAAEAAACAELGADAIGCVFFPGSPRHLSDGLARNICRALPAEVAKVGVFVNESYDRVMQKVERCGLTAVQLHGRESPDLVQALMNQPLAVIKALFAAGAPGLSEARKYRASAFLVECGAGVLPGGNALTWDWRRARTISKTYPVILAGGLSPDNVSEAMAACLPAAVDVSSGVEKAPGIKDLARVRAFLDAVSACASEKYLPRVF